MSLAMLARMKLWLGNGVVEQLMSSRRSWGRQGGLGA